MPSLNAVLRLSDGYSRQINRFTQMTNRFSRGVVSASRETDRLNTSTSRTGRDTSGLDKLTSKLKRVASMAALVAGAMKGMQISDQFINTRARLDLMNDGLQTTAELQDKILSSAKRSRGAYSDMANSVAKLGMLAGENFSNNDEVIAFTELMQKSFKLSGASGQEQSAGMYQLTQAMAAGKLQGDEFKSIMENAPMLADAIAEYVGVSKGELKELSSEGKITSDIIKEAMFASADEINEKFKTMPKTFGDYWTSIKNTAISAFTPLMLKINELLNSEGFEKFWKGVTNGINNTAIALTWIVSGFIAIGNAVARSWGIIEPILLTIGWALIPAIAYKIKLLTVALWATIKPVLAKAAAWMAVHWPIMLVFAAIGLVIYILGKLGVTFEDVFAFVGGTIGVFVAHFYNYFVFIWNFIADFINFFGNVFNDPIASIEKLFADMTVNVLGFIENIAKGMESLLNAIGLEVNITSGLTSMKDAFAQRSEQIANENDLKEFIKSKDFMDYSEASKTGAKMGSKAYDKVSGLINGILPDFNNGSEGMTPESNIPGIDDNNPMPVTNGSGSSKDLNVSVDKEDIKYLQDIAEREYIAKYSTATLAPNVQVTFGDVHETADSNKIAKVVEQILVEEIAVVAEG